MTPCTLKNKLQNFEVQFKAEPSNFFKCVLIHDYMDFLFKEPMTTKVVCGYLNDMPMQVAMSLGHDQAIFEAEYFETDLKFIATDCYRRD